MQGPSPPNILKDRLLYSPIDKIWAPGDIEGGSFHNHMISFVRKHTEEHGDWLWLHNRLTGDKLMASDYERLSKK